MAYEHFDTHQEHEDYAKFVTTDYEIIVKIRSQEQ